VIVTNKAVLVERVGSQFDLDDVIVAVQTLARVVFGQSQELV